MGFLHGKRALITGVLNHRSIAWGIANAMHREGAELAFTYVNDKLKDRVDEAAVQFGSSIVLPCDVTSDADIENLFAELGREARAKWPPTHVSAPLPLPPRGLARSTGGPPLPPALSGGT